MEASASCSCCLRQKPPLVPPIVGIGTFEMMGIVSNHGDSNILAMFARILSFEGVCLDSRHPSYRRAWKKGSEPHFLTPLPADPLNPLNPVDPLDPDLSSKIQYLMRRR